MKGEVGESSRPQRGYLSIGPSFPEKKTTQNPCKDLGDKAKQMHQISPDMLEIPILNSPFQITWNVDSCTKIAIAPWPKVRLQFLPIRKPFCIPPGEFKSQSPECS